MPVCFNSVGVKLQTVEIDLSTVVDLYKSLILFLNSFFYDMVERFVPTGQPRFQNQFHNFMI